MSDFTKITLNDFIETLTDYHANGSYKVLKSNVILKKSPDYAIMIRTLNFERPDFKNDLIYLNEQEYNYLKKTKVYPNDILMNKIANPGSVYLMPDLDKPVSLAMNLFLIRFNDDVNQQFMYYLMRHNEKYIKQFANGTTTLTITKDSVRNLKFKVPQKYVQDKIAKVLSNIEHKIELNNKINAELEAMAKLIYDYWFVQFDFPDANGKPYKSSGGKMVYNKELKCEIPDSWAIKPLESSGEFKNGKGIKKTEFSESGTYEVYGANGIIGKTNLSLFSKPVIVIGRVGVNYGEVHYSLKPCWVSDNAVTAQPVNGEWYWWLLLILKGVNYNSIAGGSAQPLITQGKLKSLIFAIPSTALMSEFYKKINPLFLKIQNTKEQNEELVELRDWLLPMLMNGQVTVQDT